MFVNKQGRLAGAWAEALRSGSVMLEVKTDPNVPPLPLHITLAQAKAFTSTLIKDDPEEGQHDRRHRQGSAQRTARAAGLTGWMPPRSPDLAAQAALRAADRLARALSIRASTAGV
jgi:hypothetical protein